MDACVQREVICAVNLYFVWNSAEEEDEEEDESWKITWHFISPFPFISILRVSRYRRDPFLFSFFFLPVGRVLRVHRTRW